MRQQGWAAGAGVARGGMEALGVGGVARERGGAEWG